MISKTTGILVGVSLSAFVMLSSCGGMFGKGGSDSASIKEALDKAIAENNEIKVDSGGYKISIPKHMTVSTELNDDASLQYQDIYKELYVIVIDEPKTDFIKTFSDPELNEYNDKLTPEKNYRMVQMKSMKEKMTMKNEPGIKKQTINGLDAEVVDFTGTVEGVESDIYYKLAFVEGTKNLYMIMTWTLDSDKNKNSEEMDQMIQSFKLSDAK